jgi:putative peptidoglycan lipid II flippase
MFEYGKFSGADTARTASALAWFSAGLPAYVLIRVLSPGFYAREDTKSPVYYGVASLVANTVLAVALVWPPFGWKSLDVDGIAIATAIGAWVNAGLLGYVLHRRGHWRPDKRLASRLPRILLAALLMASALVPAAWALRGFFADAALYRFGAIGVLVGGGIALYFALCFILRAAGIGEFKRLIPRRRKKNAGAGGGQNDSAP